MIIISQFTREQIDEHMESCDWVDKDIDTGQLYTKFDEIRIMDKSVEFFFKGEAINSIEQIFERGKGETLCITGIEGRIKFHIHL